MQLPLHRQLLAGLAAGISALSLPTEVLGATRDSAIDGLLDAMAWRLLATDPEQATSLGLDKG